MAHLVLIRSEYNEHLHRLQDLKTCLNRIQLEDGDTVDKTKANEICETFSCFQNVWASTSPSVVGNFIGNFAFNIINVLVEPILC